MIKLKRIYEKSEKNDGFRILVDRLWPRGISKNKAKIDLWIKEIAPSYKLRKWFLHKIDRWATFKTIYFKELKSKKELLKQLKDLNKNKKIITLLYAAKDKERNNAKVLLEFIER